MALKDKLKEKRIENGLTLEEAAKKLGVSKPTLHRYESGVISNIPSDKIEGFAEIYKTTPAYLMGWEDEKGNSLIGSKKNIDPISQLSKKEKFEYDKFMEDAIYFFNDETVSDEDKKKLLDGLQTAFFTILLKKENKKKKKK